MRISDSPVEGRCGSIVCQDWTLSDIELEELVSELLEDPRDKGNGRLRELTLREALIVASGYVRNNITEEVWAQTFDLDQSTISRHITFLTPLTGKATA